MLETISVFELINYFVDNQIPCQGINFVDNTYLLPKKEWIATEFAKSFEEFKTKNGIDKYSDQRHDCDDFAEAARFWMKHLYLKTKTSEDIKADIAFGLFDYQTRFGGYHAINFFFYYENGLKIGFFEPQTSEIVDLTIEEIKSNIGGRI